MLNKIIGTLAVVVLATAPAIASHNEAAEDMKELLGHLILFAGSQEQHQSCEKLLTNIQNNRTELQYMMNKYLFNRGFPTDAMAYIISAGIMAKYRALFPEDIRRSCDELQRDMAISLQKKYQHGPRLEYMLASEVIRESHPKFLWKN